MIIETQDKDGKNIVEDVCPYFEVTRIIKKIPPDTAPEEAEVYVNNGNFQKTFRLELENVSDMQYVMKIFKWYNNNIFVCDFENNDYFWLNDTVNTLKKNEY